MLRMNNRIALGSNLGKSIGNGTTSRYMSDLDGTADYYTIPQVPILINGDFNLKASFSITTSGTMLFGNSASSADYFWLSGNTNLRISLSGTVLNYTLPSVIDGKFNTIEIDRTSNVMDVIYNGVSIGGQASTAAFEIDYIGRWATNSLYFNGVISDVNINNGQRIYKINEDLSATSTIIDSGSDGSNGTAISISSSELFTLVGNDWIGEQLLDEPNFDATGNWTLTAPASISGGELILTAYPLYTFPAQQLGVVVDGYNYQTKFIISEYTNGGIRFNFGVNVGTTRTAIGEYIENIIVDGTTNASIQSVDAVSSTLKVSSSSVKRILQAP